MNSEEIKDRRAQLKMALGLSYLERALGKSSHGMFNACMENALDNFPRLKNELHGVDLHHAGNAWSVILLMKQKIPSDVKSLISGTIPDIRYIRQLLDEEEDE